MEERRTEGALVLDLGAEQCDRRMVRKCEKEAVLEREAT
jgi:hypothetical protein